jgi:transposase
MKTVVKINPDKEYEKAKDLITDLSYKLQDTDSIAGLGDSVDNLKTVINVLMEREEARRGRPKPPKKETKKDQKKKEREESKKLPSEKFPNVEVDEQIKRPDEIPLCPCCNEEMKESGLFDTSEKLETIPQTYYIKRTKRVKYNCGKCHGALVNTPAEPSIVPTSNYGDSLIIDAALSKYCDLIPLERYCAMAARNGLEGLPPNSLIGVTHHLANFLKDIYEKIKQEILNSSLIRADETPHKMLEGSETPNWYMWGFFTQRACYFEAHKTRSGNVPVDFLIDSKVDYLLTDGYAGYKKAIKSLGNRGKKVVEVYCNAHAYRYFKQAFLTWKEESEVFLKLYGDIYELERSATNEEELQLAREKMISQFNEIKNICENVTIEMKSSSLEKAVNYFLNHFEGLTICTTNIGIPLDNNASERSLRSSVIGRKTWYGTHSKRGAVTNAILFSIIETCKINNINPRNYFPWIVKKILNKEDPLTPYEYSLLPKSG